MQITESKFEDNIQLTVEGRVDVTSAPALQTAILTAFQKTSKLTIDLAKTEYVSSAGLRAFLIGHKTAASKGGAMRIINVSDAVKSVMEVSGLATIFTIE